MLNTWTFLFILVLSFELSAKLGSKKFLWHFVLKKPTKKRKTLGTLLMLTNVAFFSSGVLVYVFIRTSFGFHLR